jgi:hypothetical protein
MNDLVESDDDGAHLPQQARELILDQTPPYGALPPAGVVGGQDFMDHDGSKSWSDGGALESALARVGNEIIGEQVKLAVYEYVTQQRGFTTLVQDRPVFAVDSSNAVVDLATFWRHDLSLFAAIAQAIEANDAIMLQAIGNMIGDVVERLPAEFRPSSFRSDPPPAPSVRIRTPGGGNRIAREGAVATQKTPGKQQPVRGPAGQRPGPAPSPARGAGRLGQLR